MPSSSGGGSHSGGSSGGGGGFSSSGGGSHGGGSFIRTQSSYFKGSHRYVCYHDGHADYIYSSSKSLNKPTPWFLKLALLCFYIPFFVIGIYLFTTSVHWARPIDTPSDGDCVIEDTTGRFSPEEEKSMLAVLNDFKKTTGIPVYILTESNDAWEGYYSDLSTYAYDVYLNLFDDEKHWLIIYSDDLLDRQSARTFCNWYFEGMKGDDTADILRPSVAASFNDDLTKQLMKRSNTTAQAFIIAFEDFIPNVMGISCDWEIFGFSMLWTGFSVIHFCIMFVGMFKNDRKYKDYIACPDDNVKDVTQNEVKCEYCGGIYYKGTVINCPHCGASVPYSGDIVSSDSKRRRYYAGEKL